MLGVHAGGELMWFVIMALVLAVEDNASKKETAEVLALMKQTSITA